jgi:hypothetical protein
MAFETVSTLGLHLAWLSIITKKSKKLQSTLFLQKSAKFENMNF